MIRKLNQSDASQYARPHDDWYCVPVTVADDDSENVILVQRPSIRRLRKQFTWAVTAFVAGSLLILFQSEYRNDFLAPGPLSSSHAQLLAGLGADRCNACHEVGNQSFMQWAIASLQPGRNVQNCQSELCMSCHQATMDPALATKPHNTEPSLLAGMNKQFVSMAAADGSASSIEDIECSTCHKEHHGGKSLTFLTDQQCQTCHQQQFHSFEHGHPEFTNWPHTSRQSIAFDHVSHGFKHFPESKVQFDCKICHMDDAYSNVKTLASFEQSCAQCHQDDIHLRSEPGLPIVELPMLDLDAIQRHGLSVGNWPETASGDFDGMIPELMQMLLCSDDDFLKIIDRRGSQFDLADLDPESQHDVKDAVSIAWSIKKLIYELAVGSENALPDKFAAALDISPSDTRLHLLSRGLDAGVFANAAKTWLPGLAEELTTQSKRSTVAIDRFEVLVARIENESIVQYVPSSTHQDQDTLVANPLQNLMESESSVDPAPGSAEVGEAKKLENQKSVSRPISNDQPKKVASQDPISPNELLAANPLSGLSSSSRPSLEPHDNDFDVSQITQEFADALENSPSRSKTDSVEGPIQLPTRKQEITVGTSGSNGWYRNDKFFQISYRPTGHADDFLATMMDVVASRPDAARNPATAAYLTKMTSESSIGACNDCHTIDAESETMRVNWGANYRDPTLRSFTHFSHRPHLIQKELADCTACHQLNTELTNAHTFEHFDSSDAISNFVPIRKSNCVSCHHESGAGNSCSQCHDYHVGAKTSMGN